MSPVRATVGEIHAYPLRPAGYAEPLFHTAESRKEILEHLARSGWLGKASELTGRSRRREVSDARPVERVLASWREVDRWWEPAGGVDRVCYLVRTTAGAEEIRARASRQACAA